METKQMEESGVEVFDEKFENFYSKVESIATKNHDYVVSMSDVHMVDGIVRIPDVGEYRLSNRALQQFSYTLGIYTPYVKKMRDKGAYDLMEYNFNYWMKKSEKKAILLRTNGKTVNAVLSPRYKAIDNLAILNIVRDTFMKSNVNLKFHKGMMYDGNVYLQFMDPQKTIYLEPEEKEDVYQFGVAIQNSEVGEHSFEVEEYIYRQVCTNGMMVKYGGYDDKWFHIGGKKTNFDYSNDPQYIKESNKTLDEIKKALEKPANMEYRESAMDALRKLKRKSVSDPDNFAKALKQYFMLSDKDVEIINKVREGDTYYDWLQAITRTANYYTNEAESKSVKKRIDFEKFGGLLMSDDGKIWGHLELVTKDYALKDKKKNDEDEDKE